MRIAIITDIHEDIRMLEKALHRVKSAGHDILVCLGDITGFSNKHYQHQPDANACIDLIRENADIVLAGNHDLFTVKRLPDYHVDKNMPLNWYEMNTDEQRRVSKDKLWLYEDETIPEISSQNHQFLLGLKVWQIFETNNGRILFSHFIEPDTAGVTKWFPSNSIQFRHHFRLMKENSSDLAFMGHFHPEGANVVNKLFWLKTGFNPVKVKRKPAIILCPAIVPRDKNSSFLIYDTLRNEITPYFFE